MTTVGIGVGALLCPSVHGRRLVPAPTAEKEIKKKKSTHFPSMAVCCATLFSPTKGKNTWGVEIQQDNPLPPFPRR
jgi:hypothetical protein